MTDPESGTPVDATVVPDLVARDRRSGAPAMQEAARDRTYGYDEFCTTAYKVGNVLRHLGVHEGARVAVEPGAVPQPILAFFGGALLGATVSFDAAPGTDARAVVVDAARETEFDLPAGSRLCVFGEAPERSGTTHWETEVWSENPAFPPADYDPAAAVLAAEGTAYDHATLLDAARDAAATLGLDAADRVALSASLADPRAVVAGVLAPLLVGAAIRLPTGDAPTDAASGPATAVVIDGSARTVTGDVPTLSLADVPL